MDTPANRMLRWVQLCAACRRGLGYWHAMTMSASHGVAQARYELGDLFGAANEALTVCNHRTTALGERHIDTLTSRLCAVMWQAEAAGLQAHTLKAAQPGVQPVQEGHAVWFGVGHSDATKNAGPTPKSETGVIRSTA